MDKNKMYWRNRALKAETEIYALKQAMLQSEIKIGWFQQLRNWWSK